MDELFTRGIMASAGLFGFLDLLPVAERHDIRSARFKQRIKRGATRFPRPGANIFRNQIHNRKAVWPVGADGPVVVEAVAELGGVR